MKLKDLIMQFALLACLALPVHAAHVPVAIDPGAADQLTVIFGDTVVFSGSTPEGPIESISSGPLPLPGPFISPGTYLAYLLEPVTSDVSDQIVAEVTLTTMTVGLFSDPLVPPTCPDLTKCLVEDGTLQDVTTALFGVITAPIEVLAFSDIDARVPEPGTLALLAVALAALRYTRRRVVGRASGW